jgi:ABC-type phosphate transport system substrate-binding protein
LLGQKKENNEDEKDNDKSKAVLNISDNVKNELNQQKKNLLVTQIVFDENQIIYQPDGKSVEKITTHHKEFKGKSLLKVKI